MLPPLRERETELPSSPTLADAKPDYSLLAGNDFSLKDTSDIWDSDLNGLIQRILHRNCNAVCKLAASRTPELRKVVARIGNMIAADLEARLLRAARAKGRINSSRGKRRNDSPLDTWALDILEWTESQPLPLSNESNESDGGGDSDKSDESLYSGDFEPIGIYSDYVATCFESFMLFQSILSLENSRTGRSPLEDAESLFYLARILGTFGINREQRAEFVADPDMSILD